MKRLTIKIDNGTYSPFLNGRTFYPLPYGWMKVENALIKGNCWNSHGGRWYYRLPDFCYVGYGRYAPYAEFYFTGIVVVTRERDFVNHPIEQEWYGGRMSTNRWIYFKGEFKPSKLFRAERIIRELIRKCVEIPHTEMSQGHLLLKRIEEPPLFQNFLDTVVPDRRRIFNHQFYGYYRIFYLGDGWGRKWVVFCDGEVKVVSPDHLDQPLILDRGAWIAEHPLPGGDDNDAD